MPYSHWLTKDSAKRKLYFRMQFKVDFTRMHESDPKAFKYYLMQVSESLSCSPSSSRVSATSLKGLSADISTYFVGSSDSQFDLHFRIGMNHRCNYTCSGQSKALLSHLS